MPYDLLSELQARVLVCDGAMGTMLYAAGLPLDRLPPEANLSDPDMVHSTHGAYLAAGVNIIQTNTFSPSRHRLSRSGADDRAVEINRAGVRLAIEARDHSGRQASIAGSVSPATPPGFRARWATEDVRTALHEQVEVLV